MGSLWAPYCLEIHHGGPGRYSHVKTYGDVPQFRVGFFFNKTLNMGPFFMEKVPKYGFDFQNVPEFAMETPWIFENLLCSCGKIARNVCFVRKIPKYFWKNYPWTWVWVLSFRRYIPDKSICKYPPGTAGNEMVFLVTGGDLSTISQSRVVRSRVWCHFRLIFAVIISRWQFRRKE